MSSYTKGIWRVIKMLYARLRYCKPFLCSNIIFVAKRLSETLTLDSSISEFLSICPQTFAIANQSPIIWFVLGKQAAYR